MTYSSGGLIQATDYNNIVGTNPTNATNTVNAVWGTGNGYLGYGQTPIATVSSTNVVTATQWATLINSLNSIRTHQTGSNSGISAVTSGQLAAYLSTLTTQVGYGYGNALVFASNAAVSASVGGTFTSAWTSTSTSSTLTRGFGLRAAFGNADQARYFFNAGGRIKYNVSGAQNASTTGRTNDIITLCTGLGGIATFGSNTNGGRTGTGITVNTNDTTKGYYTTTKSSNVVVIAVTSTTTAYTSDTANITVQPNGTAGSNNDNGPNLDFWTNLSSTSGSNGTGGAYSFDDSFGVTITQTIDISYPETTNLSNTWGAVTVTQL